MGTYTITIKALLFPDIPDSAQSVVSTTFDLVVTAVCEDTYGFLPNSFFRDTLFFYILNNSEKRYDYS